MSRLLKLSHNRQGIRLEFSDRKRILVPAEAVLKFHLHEGMELDPAGIKNLVNFQAEEKFFAKAVNLISYRPRSKAEIERYLRHQDVAPKLIAKIMARLKKNEFIDDDRFSHWWVEQRLAHRPKGRWLLQAELASKGIDRALIADVLATVSPTDELSQAKRILDKKQHLWQKFPDRLRFQKAAAYLFRQGFSAAIVRRLVDSRLADE